MLLRPGALLGSIALLAPVGVLGLISPNTCPAAVSPDPGGPISWWNTAGYSGPATLQNSDSYVYVDDGCGLGGTIGVKFLRGGPSPTPVSGLSWYNATDDPYAGYDGYQPQGLCPDRIMPQIFGTYEQSIFTSDNTLCSIRFYETGDVSAMSFYIDLDFSKYDCTNRGAPSKGATYAGTLIGFSDYFAGPPSQSGSTASIMTYTGTTLAGGAASDFASWVLYNSEQTEVTPSSTTPYWAQGWNAGSTSGEVQGAGELAPPGFLTGGYDTNFALLSLSPDERYTSLRIEFNTVNGAGDFSGFTIGSAPAGCPEGTFLNPDTGLCETCPKGTYFFASANTGRRLGVKAAPMDGPNMCFPCAKGQTTLGCGATSSNECHKPCMPGSFYDVNTLTCTKCPAGTFWPATGLGKTDYLETTECLPCPGSTKVGASTCAAWTAAYTGAAAKNKTKTTKSWKK